MYIFKTSGETLESVIKNQKHAFKGKPTDWYKEEIILVCKVKDKKQPSGEKQIQYTMRLHDIRPPEPREIETLWPGNEGRWKHLIECYDTIKLDFPFNLEEILGMNAKKYGPAVSFKKLEPEDEIKIVDHLKENNGLQKEPIIEEKHLIETEIEKLNKSFENSDVKKKEKISTNIERNPRIVALLKRLHPEKCQICKEEHFFKKNRERYSEVHHIIPLSEGGTQATDNCLVLCSTCHKKMHFANVEIKPIDRSSLKIIINGKVFNAKRNILSGSGSIV